MTWRLAKSLVVLRDEVNAHAPERSKASDGTLGDQAHAARQSDHNPDQDGVVCAIDITDDPAHGHDDRIFAEHLRQLGRAGDGRVKYVISNGRIAGPTARGWTWRTYTGANAHDKHTHLSVTQAGKDSTAPWGWHVPITTQGDWFDMASKAELAEVVEDTFRKVVRSGVAVMAVEGRQYVVDEFNGTASWIHSDTDLQKLVKQFGTKPGISRSELESRFTVDDD